MDRSQVLEEKALEINDELASWAKKNNFLAPGERLSFTLVIVKEPTVSHRTVVGKIRGRRYRVVSKELTNADWDRIFLVPSRSGGSFDKIRKVLRANRNRPTLGADLCKKATQIEGANAKMRNAGLPYRIKRLPKLRGESRWWSERFHQFIVVE